MVRMTTLETHKVIALAVSPVPSPAQAAVLRSVGGVLPFQAYPALLAHTLQTLREQVVQPMRQASIQRPGKRSPEKLFDMFQILDTQHADVGPVDLLQGVAHQALDICMGMFLAFGKALNRLVGCITRILPIGKHEPVLVIRIHTHDSTHGLRHWPRLLQQHLDEQPSGAPPQTNGLPQRPALLEQAIKMLGAVERKRQAWRSRTDQAQGIVKMRPGKGLQTYKVRVERSGPATYPRL